MEIKDNTPLRKPKGIPEGIESAGFRIVAYYVRSKSRRIFEIQDQTYHVPGLPKGLSIIYPQGIRTS